MITTKHLLIYLLLINRLTGGDGGVDIIGNYKGHWVLVQCKDYTATKISVDKICAFEGVMSRYMIKNAVGIFVVSAEQGYSRNAIERARQSKYSILLTSFAALQQDISSYLAEKFNEGSAGGENNAIENLIVALNRDRDREMSDLKKNLAVLISMIRILFVLLVGVILINLYSIFR